MPRQLAYLRAHATYSGKSLSQINSFRNQKISDFASANISGYIILADGDVWLRLEGEHADVEDEHHELQGESFFDMFDGLTFDELNSRTFDEAYAYYETEAPMST